MTFQFNKLHLCGVINNLNVHSTDELEMSLNSSIICCIYMCTTLISSLGEPLQDFTYSSSQCGLFKNKYTGEQEDSAHFSR